MRRTRLLDATEEPDCSQTHSTAVTCSTVHLFRELSYGIHVLELALQLVTPLLTDHFDIEIIEKHHNRKLDAPSGTAFMLLRAMNQTVQHAYKPQFERVGQNTKRKTNEIGIHAIRAGNIVGEHEIIFASNEEVITLKHEATSRRVFADGAIRAAKYLIKKDNGLYNMHDLVKEKNNATL